MAALKVADKGFTLLEVLLTVTLMAVGFILLLQAMNVGFFAGGENEAELVATNLAQEKAEEIRNKTFSTIALEDKAAMAAPFGQFSRSVAVNNNTPVTSMKKVTVTVYWNTRGVETSKTLITYVSDI